MAEHVLHFWERVFPDDPRPRAAIEAGRQFIAGEINSEKLIDTWHNADIPVMESYYSASAEIRSAYNSARYSARSAFYSARGFRWSAWAATRAAATAEHAFAFAHDNGMMEHNWQRQRAVAILGGASDE